LPRWLVSAKLSGAETGLFRPEWLAAPTCPVEVLTKTEASAKAGKARKLAKRNNLDTKVMKILAFNRLCVRIVLISTLYGLRIYCERFFRLSYAKFKVVNPIILFNFNILCYFCLVKKAEVQNFEPHPIIKKWFKNNRFFNLRPDRVKNYEPNAYSARLRPDSWPAELDCVGALSV